MNGHEVLWYTALVLVSVITIVLAYTAGISLSLMFLVVGTLILFALRP
jgi:hypothetical protein